MEIPVDSQEKFAVFAAEKFLKHVQPWWGDGPILLREIRDLDPLGLIFAVHRNVRILGFQLSELFVI